MLPSTGNRPDVKAGSRFGFLRGPGTRAGWFALAVFLAGLSDTAFLAYYQKAEADQVSAREFGFVCREIQAKIEARLSDHAQILRSGAAFFSHDNGITRTEWHVFVERQKISRKLPGIQGFGFAKLVPCAQLAQHIQEIRSEGFADYRINPEGDRGTYSAIIYLEPFTDRNLRAFGYDMLSEPVRRAAMERARDLDEVALTGKVTLVQETGKDIQAGTLMFAPVYRKGMPSGTLAERRAALFGWVYSPYRMTDLLEGILGRWDSAGQRIHLKIFDGATATPDALLYDSQPGADTKPQMSWQTTLDSGGREWLLSFSEAGEADFRNASLVLGGGTIISLLLAGLVLSLASTRVSALMREKQLTAELALALDRLSLATKAGRVGVWDYDIAHNKLAWDDQMFALYGITKESIGGTYEAWKAGVHPEDAQRGDQEIQMALSGKKDFDTEFRVVRPDGSIRAIRALAIVQRSPSGEPLRMIGTNQDITERRREQEVLRNEIARRRELEQEVMAIAESEQRRIGYDLHDGICQELAGIQFVAELIARRLPAELPEKDLLAKTVEDIRKVVLHTRQLSRSLSPVVLEKGDLSTALAELAVNTRNTFGIACAFSCPTPPEIPSSSAASHLYRIAQESVQNAIRHGKATSIDISLMPSGIGWMLQVADNGTPSEPENTSGRGLQIMHYRASMFGGSLRVQFRENCGTIITCTFSP